MVLRNDLYCVEWGVKLYSLTHPVANPRVHGCSWTPTPRRSPTRTVILVYLERFEAMPTLVCYSVRFVILDVAVISSASARQTQPAKCLDYWDDDKEQAFRFYCGLAAIGHQCYTITNLCQIIFGGQTRPKPYKTTTFWGGT